MPIRDLLPPRDDFAIWRGDGVGFDVTVTNSATGAAYALTGHSLWCTVKRNLADTDLAALWQGTEASGIIITGAAQNVARVVMPGSATAILTEPTALYYDVQIKAAGGQAQTVAWGIITVQMDVTRAI